MWILGEVIENSDWSCIVNIEKKKSTGQYYLTFKRIKIRYKPIDDFMYFNHPFVLGNMMKLITDVELPQHISESSLASDMEAVVFKKGKRTAVDRPVVDESSFDGLSEIK